MKIIKAEYKTSVVEEDKLLQDDVPEFAFVGRSNVGKSSLINALVGQKRLAKTSSTAGLTKMINYFDIFASDCPHFRLVDLPGYGYAKVGKSHLDVWSGLMGQYLTKSQSLQVVFVLLDVRIKPTDLDKNMIAFLIYNNIPFSLIATKCDKLSKMAVKNAIDGICRQLNVRKDIIIPSSSQSKQGVQEILQYIQGVASAKRTD